MDPCIVKSLRDNRVTIDFSYGMFDERDECVFERRGNEHSPGNFLAIKKFIVVGKRCIRYLFNVEYKINIFSLRQNIICEQFN